MTASWGNVEYVAWRDPAGKYGASVTLRNPGKTPHEYAAMCARRIIGQALGRPAVELVTAPDTEPVFTGDGYVEHFREV